MIRQWNRAKVLVGRLFAPITRFGLGLALLTALLAGTTGFIRAEEGGIETVVRVGQPTPDGNSTFFNITIPNALSQSRSLNDQGRVVFTALLDSGAATGLFAWQDGELTQLVRSGDPAPVVGTFANLHVSTVWQNNTGGILFLARLAGTPGGDGDNQGVYWYDGGEVKEVVRTGLPLPVESGAAWNGLGNGAAISDNGTVVLSLSFNDSQEGDNGIFRWDGNALTKVVRNGDPLPANSTITANVTAFSGNFQDLQLNNAGEIAFSNTRPADRRRIYRTTPDGLTEVAGAPGVDFRNPRLNNDGFLAFGSIQGLFTQASSDAEVQTVVSSGNPTPHEGDTFSSFVSSATGDLVLAPSGIMAFRAGVNSDAGLRICVFLTAGETITQIIRGAVLSELGGLGPEDPRGVRSGEVIAVNSAGFVAFEDSSGAIFVSDGTTTTRVGAGPIPGGSMGSPNMVRHSPFNKRGQLLFQATVSTSIPANRPALLLYTPSLPPIRLTPPAIGAGAVSFTATGTPGEAFDIQRALSPEGPWNTIGSVEIDEDGTANFEDTNPPADGAYYIMRRD